MLALITRGASQARAEQLMEIMGLGRVRSSRVEHLSGGERQKLAIASAVIHHPEVLFLDEPTAALDATARHDLAELLTTMREEGTTIICTTCCPSEAEHLCDTVSIPKFPRAAGHPLPYYSIYEFIIVYSGGNSKGRPA